MPIFGNKMFDSGYGAGVREYHERKGLGHDDVRASAVAAGATTEADFDDFADGFERGYDDAEFRAEAVE